MKLRLLILLLLTVSLFIERILISIPLIFLFSYIIFSIEHRIYFLIPAAILSIAGDVLLLNPIGSTLLFVCVLQFLIYLYAMYLGSRDVLVYILVAVIGVVLYAIIFEYSLLALLKWFTLAAVVWIIYRLLPKQISL